MKNKIMINMMNQYQFLGIMLGDGCLLYYPKYRIYGIEITGNAVEEQDFFNQMKEFIKSKFNVKVRVYVRKYHNGKAIKLICYSKKLAEWLMEQGIKCNKTFSTEIPEKLLDWTYSKDIIKGIFQTDGCLYFSKSRTLKYPTYPRIEICTASLKLARQIIEILNKNDFPAKSYINGNTVTIYLSGEKNIEKWKKEVKFSIDKNKTKYLLWKKLGYYIPKITLPKRKLILEGKLPESI